MGRVATLIPVSRQRSFSALLPTVDPHTHLALSSWLKSTGSAQQEEEEEEEEVLLPGEVPVVHGIAYLLDSSSRREMLEKLAVREVAGYEPVKLTATLPSGESLSVYTFIGRVGGEHWAPERDMDTLAGIVGSATGPSGSNAEYACRLLASSRTLSSTPDVWLESLLLTLRRSHPNSILPCFGL
jgi:cation transport regulator ChaC